MLETEGSEFMIKSIIQLTNVELPGTGFSSWVLSEKPTWAAAGQCATACRGVCFPLSRLWGRLGRGRETPKRQARPWPRKETDICPRVWKSPIKNMLLREINEALWHLEKRVSWRRRSIKKKKNHRTSQITFIIIFYIPLYRNQLERWVFSISKFGPKASF